MQKIPLVLSVFILASVAFIWSCKKDQPLLAPYNGYPEPIGKIVLTTCATTGCHNANGADLAGGLNMESWEALMRGGNGGAAIIPYRPDQSFFMYFINSDSTQGPVLKPQMPFNLPAMSKSDVTLMKSWISSGAPNDEGFVKFSDNPQRKKIYVANQGCDLVAVVDEESGLIMRYVSVGQNPGYIESPHSVKISPDGKYWYVVFLAQNPYIEMYSTTTDAYVDKIMIGAGDWNTLSISTDGKYGVSVAFSAKKIVLVDLENRSLLYSYNVSEEPHGSGISPDFSTLYVTQQKLNSLYRFDLSQSLANPDLTEVDLIQGIVPVSGSAIAPHEIVFSPDGKRYLVSCQGTKEVRIFQTANDSLLKVINVGDEPVEFALSPSRNLALVTCMEDTSTFPGQVSKHGSVAVINYQNMSLVTIVYSGYQPHGLSVNDQKGLCYVANRNRNNAGPAPHHTSACAGRNGYMTIIDLSTNALVPGYKMEMSVDPYAVAYRK